MRPPNRLPKPMTPEAYLRTGPHLFPHLFCILSVLTLWQTVELFISFMNTHVENPNVAREALPKVARPQAQLTDHL
ncbi:hypothetical protein EUGRSUZ_G01260 [Eucalyptus grandis]|uniref:Uncharacterized protein n=2 Tax=Eucalyptus grandis TaxID=71139 RepID=A0ACC3K398_EUCGR|nr:hypothetical protein EUGRSUZ_G01260 [Eucalyptus grandis]